VGESEQAEVAALSVVRATADMSALATFDHRDYRFHLRTATIGLSIEPRLHEAAVTARRRLDRGSAVLGRDDRPYAVAIASKAVIGFGVIAGVGRQLRQPPIRSASSSSGRNSSTSGRGPRPTRQARMK
jgi:hypothetical protein